MWKMKCYGYGPWPLVGLFKVTDQGCRDEEEGVSARPGVAVLEESDLDGSSSERDYWYIGDILNVTHFCVEKSDLDRSSY